MMHSIDNDGGYSPVKATELNAHLEYVYANKDKFWVETFGNVARYIKERDAVSLVVVSSDSKKVVVQLTDSLDNSIYNYPVSIRRPLPTGWVNASVKQGKVKLNSQLVVQNSIQYIQFDAVPDGGPVVIAKAKKVKSSDIVIK